VTRPLVVPAVVRSVAVAAAAMALLVTGSSAVFAVTNVDLRRALLTTAEAGAATATAGQLKLVESRCITQDGFRSCTRFWDSSASAAPSTVTVGVEPTEAAAKKRLDGAQRQPGGRVVLMTADRLIVVGRGSGTQVYGLQVQGMIAVAAACTSPGGVEAPVIRCVKKLLAAQMSKAAQTLP
jgi:hypothetical protein